MYYVKTKLLSILHAGNIIVMDNLRCHKVDDVREAIEGVDATVLYLPPYSPDLNPIEMLRSKIKAILRERKTRCTDKLFNVVTDTFQEISLSDITGWFSYCGHQSLVEVL